MHCVATCNRAILRVQPKHMWKDIHQEVTTKYDAPHKKCVGQICSQGRQGIEKEFILDFSKYQLNAQCHTVCGWRADCQSALHPHTVRLLTDGDDTRGCGDTIGPPEDEQRAARNMLRSVV